MSEGWRIGEGVAPGARGKGVGAVTVVRSSGRDVGEGRRVVVVWIVDGDGAGDGGGAGVFCEGASGGGGDDGGIVSASEVDGVGG